MTPLERLVLAIEQSINGRQRQQDHPAWGEDVKVMGIRHGNAVHLTIACAMIGRYLANMDEYLVEKSAIERLANELALVNGFSTCEVKVNAADDPAGGAVYLTVTGTSAEAGDDGEVGRGNRVNGLITPCRPMSLEAAAGKNPVSHVGKLYNVASRNIAETLTATMPEIAAAQCLMVSRIGMPVTDPAIVQIKVATHGDIPVDRLERRIKDITADGLRKIPELIDDFMAGAIGVF
jgi:S-adenosylmethionine synthetase